MKLKRYYTNNPLINGQKITLDGEEYHHLKNVMRTNKGDHILLFNGTNIEAEGEVLSLSKQSGEILILNTTENLSEPKVNVCLFQAVCKGEKLSLITQKVTELGASEMVVFYSNFTDIKDKTNKLEKLEKVSISACKQCGRSSVLKITGVLSFNQVVDRLSMFDKVFVAYENANQTSLFDSLVKNNSYKNIAIIIGAEGGFSASEISMLEDNNVEIVTLGKRILRTETASIVSVAQIMFATEKWFIYKTKKITHKNTKYTHKK